MNINNNFTQLNNIIIKFSLSPNDNLYARSYATFKAS